MHRPPTGRLAPSALRLGSALAVGLAWLGLAGCGERAPEAKATDERPNVLFLVVDDLLPQLGCYGVEGASTPSMDALARSGQLFERAYCQVALCQPSRASVLSGTRPATNQVYDLQTPFRRALPDIVSLPQLFREQGYTTYALGKVHHGRAPEGEQPDWSATPWRPEGGQLSYASAEYEAALEHWRARGELEPLGAGPYPLLSTEAPDVPDEALPDGQIAAAALEHLRALAAREEPFFLAVGFLKPHLPFVAPAAYWERHPPESVPAVARLEPPSGAPAAALPQGGETRQYFDLRGLRSYPPAVRQRLRRGYRAAVSYADAQVGKLLDALDELGLEDDTIVVLWGDHGWHLGEQGTWGKMTNFEAATRVPLLLRAPGHTRAGARSEALVELVDLYPTLAELCALPLPDHLEGASLAPLLSDPDREWKSAVFSELRRPDRRAGELWGRSIRTPRYRLTQWSRGASPNFALELYDYAEGEAEVLNVARRSEYADQVRELTRRLEQGWSSARPKR